MQVISRQAVALVAFVASLELGACQPAQVPPQVIQKMASVQTQVQLGREAIIGTGTAIKNLRESQGKDIAAAFALYDKKLAALEAQAGTTRTAIESSQTSSEEYFQGWEKEINRLSDEDLRSRTEDRRKAAQASYKEVKVKLDALRNSFRPYLASLRDTRRVMSLDLTASGLKAARPSIDQAMDRQKLVLKDLENVTSAIEKLKAH